MMFLFYNILFIVLLAVSNYANMPPSPPTFSWDSIPLFIHAGNASGLLNDTAAKYMSTFPIATLPHFQGGPDGHIDICDPTEQMICEEDAELLGLQQIRSYSNDTRTLFYLNTLLNFPWYNLANEFVGENEKYLLHYNGNIVYWTECHPTKPNVTLFDLSQNETRNMWLNTIKYALTSPNYTNVVDGVFADRGRAQLQIDVGCINWTETQINEWNIGHALLIQETMKMVNDINPMRGIVIPNGADIEQVNGRMFESFAYNDSNAIPSGNDLNTLINDNGIRITEVHKDQCNPLNKTADYNQTLAAYLIGAYKYSYYGCTKGFSLQNDWDIIWQNKDYNKPLGEPISNATYNNETKIYYREFTKGVKVWLQKEWASPCIQWSDGSITGTTSDCSKYDVEKK